MSDSGSAAAAPVPPAASGAGRGRLLITGGAGFLGWHLGRGLAGWDLVLLDREEFREDDVPPGARAVVADVRDRTALSEAMSGCRAVIHAAAALPLWKAAEIRSVNLDGTRAVLETARACGVERVVQISSTAVYGVPDHHPLAEDDELHGVGPYGESKVAAEGLCVEARASGMCVPILRPKTFLGPERLGVFQILFEWVREGRRIPVIGSGENRYQLLAVEDVVAAAALVLEAPADAANRTFNLGAREFGTVADDLGALFEHAGSGSRVLATPAWLAKGALGLFAALRLSPLYKWVYGTADQDSWVRTDRIEALGWSPRYSNADTLIHTYDWYLAHRGAMEEAGVGHRVPWREGVLSLVKRFL